MRRPARFRSMEHSCGETAGTAHIPIGDNRYGWASGIYRIRQCAPIVYHCQVKVLSPLPLFQQFFANHIDIIRDLLFLAISGRHDFNTNVAALWRIGAIRDISQCSGNITCRYRKGDQLSIQPLGVGNRITIPSVLGP